MKFSAAQLVILSNLFIDLAKGLFLASLAVPALSPGATLLVSFKGVIVGLLFTYLSLKAIELKEASQ